jgi:hypothetical protein
VICQPRQDASVSFILNRWSPSRLGTKASQLSSTATASPAAGPMRAPTRLPWPAPLQAAARGGRVVRGGRRTGSAGGHGGLSSQVKLVMLIAALALLARS